MFRPLQGHHQAFYLKQVFIILRTHTLRIILLIGVGNMFRPLQGHHQALYLKQVFKILRTFSNKRPDDDPIRVETCCLLLSTINIDVFDILIILFLLLL